MGGICIKLVKIENLYPGALARKNSEINYPISGLLEDKHASLGGIISSGISTDCAYWSEDQSPADPRFITRSMSISSDGFDEDEEPHERYCGNSDDFSSKYYYQDNGNQVYPNPKHIVEPNSYVNLEPTGKPLRNITKAGKSSLRSSCLNYHSFETPKEIIASSTGGFLPTLKQLLFLIHF